MVVGWIVLTIAGVALSGPATERFANDSSVPDTEGWETTLAIAERYGGSRDGASRPLLPVARLPAGATVESPGVKAELAAVDARLRRAATGFSPQSDLAAGRPGVRCGVPRWPAGRCE